jgi:hypothetical protein
VSTDKVSAVVIVVVVVVLPEIATSALLVCDDGMSTIVDVVVGEPVGGVVVPASGVVVLAVVPSMNDVVAV